MSQDLDSPVALCCVLQQDTISSAKYWYKPGKGVQWLKSEGLQVLASPLAESLCCVLEQDTFTLA